MFRKGGPRPMIPGGVLRVADKVVTGNSRRGTSQSLGELLRGFVEALKRRKDAAERAEDEAQKRAFRSAVKSNLDMLLKRYREGSIDWRQIQEIVDQIGKWMSESRALLHEVRFWCEELHRTRKHTAQFRKPLLEGLEGKIKAIGAPAEQLGLEFKVV